MSSAFARLRRGLFGIAPAEVTFERRGFAPAPPEIQARLEHIGRTFATGYHAALLCSRPPELETALEEVPLSDRGFAYEGAGMGLALLDLLTPWRRHRLRDFLAGPGDAHAYMVNIGAGWALARLRRPAEPALRWLDPLLGWIAFDGYGFHEGYFAWPQSVEEQRVPQRLRGYARRGFDQGLGRSLWFVRASDPDRVATTVAGFPEARRADLWSGIGLACAYAGGLERNAIEFLRKSAGPHAPWLAQGAAFAAKARQRAGNPEPHTGVVCEVLCGASADVAARACDLTLADLPPDAELPAFEVWRRRLAAYFEGGVPSD
jgi:hypothetical protein